MKVTKSRIPKTLADLRPSPANPRKISAAALAGLSKSVSAYGDLSGIVWNARSGNLVCGHQRMEALKKAHGAALGFDAARCCITTPAGDFPVRVVDWDPDTEAMANIAANALGIQGEFDDAQLQAILTDLNARGIDLELAFMALEAEIKSTEQAINPNAEYNYAVVIDHKTEESQASTIADLEQKGYTCRALIL
jgi:ParB-like chromosome segregation protein Spo0J